LNSKQEIKYQLDQLLEEIVEIIDLADKDDDIFRLGSKYQGWYTRALKIVAVLGHDRLREFRNLYEIDPQRKSCDETNYTIQDYLLGLRYMGIPKDIVSIRIINQRYLLASMASRIEGILADVEGALLAEIQDSELEAARQLLTISLRASGSLAGVLLEKHLQRVAGNHQVPINKRNPTIADINDPLRQAGIYDIPTWRRIQLMGDIRNLCSHQKDREPTKPEVEDLLSGVAGIIKSVN
jgi:hypothetical protein